MFTQSPENHHNEEQPQCQTEYREDASKDQEGSSQINTINEMYTPTASTHSDAKTSWGFLSPQSHGQFKAKKPEKSPDPGWQRSSIRTMRVSSDLEARTGLVGSPRHAIVVQ